MLSGNQPMFLFDVDNTLLDNDRFAADLGAELDAAVGPQERERYWTIYAQLRDSLGYADYLGALQGFRLNCDDQPALLRIANFLLEYPFAERLYPHALASIEHVARFGPVGILSDGDIVFQPRKIRRSGLWQAVAGRVLVYVHKEQAMAAMQRDYPASHYVIVDDKPNLLAAMKRVLGDLVTTVFVRQGHYALAPPATPIAPAPDLTIDNIGALCERDADALLRPDVAA